MAIEEPAWLKPGETEPGGWRPSPPNGAMVWSGSTSWRTRNGAAVVTWRLGKPSQVEGAVLATGETIKICYARIRDGEAQNWRRPNTRGPGFVLGTIAIADDGAVFTDAPEPTVLESLMPPASVLHAGGPFGPLWLDPSFRQEIRQDGVAGAMVERFTNTCFRVVGASEGRWLVTQRKIASVIAEMRQYLEDYVDFYPWTPDHDDRDMAVVDAALARVGWRTVTEEEDREDAERALRLLDEIESRPKGSRPDWTLDWKKPDWSRNPFERLMIAAIEGKATRAEHQAFIELVC